jgi:hypothetical protein
VTRTLPIDFRMFLLRHAELFRTLHTWTVRVLVPRRFWKTTALYKTALRDELWTPLEPHITDRLEMYFRERREAGGHISDPSDEYLIKAFRRYGAGRFVSLYRAWRRMGDPILRAASSTILRDARERGWGACEIHPLRGQYLQLTGLIDRADRATRGAKRIRGQVGPLAADSSLDSFSPPFYEAMTLNATQASTLQHIAESRPSRGRRSVPAASVRLVHRPVSQRWCEDPGALA